MPWRTIGDQKDVCDIPPALAQIEPLVCLTFDAFGRLCVVDGIEDGALRLRIRHIGQTKLQVTLTACLRRQLELTLPGCYEVTLRDPGGPEACLVVRVCAPAVEAA